jgi:hypothetical protein
MGGLFLAFVWSTVIKGGAIVIVDDSVGAVWL